MVFGKVIEEDSRIELSITHPKAQPGCDCEPDVQYNTGGVWQQTPPPFQTGLRIADPSDTGAVDPDTGQPRHWTDAIGAAEASAHARYIVWLRGPSGATLVQ